MANGMSRRQFVERSARLAVLAGLSGSILSACGSDGDSGGSGGGDTIPLARLDNPVTLPDNGSEPVAAGAEDTLRVLNYADYINPETQAAFEQEMGTKIEITVYDTEDKLLAALRNDSLTFDLVMGATTLQLPSSWSAT